MGKRKQTHEHKDQYGEYKPQDRQEHVGFNKGSGGGGTAGKTRGAGGDFSFQRQLPKFLQPYAHMLGQNKQQDEDAPAVLQEQQRRLDREDDEEQDKADEEEAIRRALEENPELAEQLGEAAMAKVEASHEKELGNAAFGAKDYETALKHFSRCIELDPKNAVYFSNRSAAAANLGRFEEALQDAKAVLRLKPGWVKGHARAAAAYMGLQLYSEAKEAYEKAVKLEPDDQALQRSLDKAAALELQHAREHKHIFRKIKAGSQKQKQQQQQGAGEAAAAAAAGEKGGKQKKKAKLSFQLEDAEDQE